MLMYKQVMSLLPKGTGYNHLYSYVTIRPMIMYDSVNYGSIYTFVTPIVRSLRKVRSCLKSHYAEVVEGV